MLSGHSSVRCADRGSERRREGPAARPHARPPPRAKPAALTKSRKSSQSLTKSRKSSQSLTKSRKSSQSLAGSTVVASWHGVGKEVVHVGRVGLGQRRVGS